MKIQIAYRQFELFEVVQLTPANLAEAAKWVGAEVVSLFDDRIKAIRMYNETSTIFPNRPHHLHVIPGGYILKHTTVDGRVVVFPMGQYEFEDRDFKILRGSSTKVKEEDI